MSAFGRTIDLDLDLTERLRRLARYGAGWDGYRASPASPVAVETACAFVAKLRIGEDIQASLEPDGTVDLAGVFGGVRMTLGFTAERTVEVSRRDGGTWSDVGTFPLLAMCGELLVPPALRSLLSDNTLAVA